MWLLVIPGCAEDPAGNKEVNQQTNPHIVPWSLRLPAGHLSRPCRQESAPHQPAGCPRRLVWQQTQGSGGGPGMASRRRWHLHRGLKRTLRPSEEVGEGGPRQKGRLLGWGG